MLEVVYENATKVDKRVFYTSTASTQERVKVVKAGDSFYYPSKMKFRLIKSETVK